MKKVIDWFEIPVRDVSRAQVLMGRVALPEGLGFMAHMRDVDGNRVGLHAYA